jgi:hypothetical protein
LIYYKIQGAKVEALSRSRKVKSSYNWMKGQKWQIKSDELNVFSILKNIPYLPLNPQSKNQKISKALKINFMQRFAV